MVLTTIKTGLGYLVTLLRKIGVIELGSQSVERIFNYVPISDEVSTSGQPSEAELKLIRDAGYSTIVNLAPHNTENSLDDEYGYVTNLGVNYIHIPVDFKNPTNDDFVRFAQTMDDLKGTKVWVHCAANMRVSAFIYKYRRDILGEQKKVAIKDLKKIWEPYGVWRSFLRKSRNGA
ncbi:MAG: protein tyrosine phosphatase family protein [Gammaproteobacteria bacterium]|nr:protein tyrosine phosphatase family protein [Gammaproteobacteria bacterium]